MAQYLIDTVAMVADHARSLLLVVLYAAAVWAGFGIADRYILDRYFFMESVYKDAATPIADPGPPR